MYVYIDEVDQNFFMLYNLKINAPFCIPTNQGLLELSYFNGFPSYCNKGIERKILDVVEEVASKISNTITLSVGLHEGYIPQIIYKKRIYSRWQWTMV